jgi:hypothetical protein
MVDYLKMPYEERLKLVTHYKRPHCEPSATVRVGFVDGGYWFDLYIVMHKSQVKRLGLIEYRERQRS